MAIIDKLATSRGNRDEAPNIALANAIAKQQDAAAIAELAGLLQHKDKNVQSDSIKVLYEIAALAPTLIAPYYKQLAALLSSKNNRLVWGAMTALDAIALVVPDEIHGLLKDIVEAAEKGSVIAKDHAVGILVKLAQHKQYAEECIQILLGMLSDSASNQFAMYAETIAPVAATMDKESLMAILNNRIPQLEKESQQKRVQKLVKKLSK